MMSAYKDIPQMPLKDLLEGFVQVDDELYVASLSVDARNIEPNGLFLAVSGSAAHGLIYAQQAIDAGVAAIVYETKEDVEFLVEKLKKQSSVRLIELPNLSAHISEIAARFYQRPSADLAVIGITGTNGKTSVSHFIAQAMIEEKTRCGVIGTMGWGGVDSLRETINTTPDGVSVQQQLACLHDEGFAVIAMEVSSHGLVQGRVNAVEYKGAVFTNLSHDHLDYHQTMQAYGQAKLALFEYDSLEFAVVNQDDAFSERILNVLRQGVRVIKVSRFESNAEIDCLFISNEQLLDSGLSFDVSLNGSSARVNSSLFGRFNVDNLALTIAALVAMGESFEDALKGVQKISSVAGRMQLVSNDKLAITVVVDYAHTPDALKLALSSLREHCKGKLKLVFGCGGDRDEAKRSLMGAVAAELADEVIITNDNPRHESAEKITAQIKSGMSAFSQVETVLSREQAIHQVIMSAGLNDIILVAGKGHENHQQIRDKKLAFSDVVEAQKALRCRAGEARCKP
ncbi:MAG: UDP-N-acetylmuramoyl-L-alanyl-D-glutamate--2,6-diaminopimelate ligase [Cycloclasticus sp. symbiont of Poecilosclerida sp. N]|nr:MAG: UDP-N-acetylmuramoyl-L-alanyl-D-glutamate--2,6-diaminopimelate ligase [Cycloclasticus sp. symbiont of Poecilosclerida sp. N]